MKKLILSVCTLALLSPVSFAGDKLLQQEMPATQVVQEKRTEIAQADLLEPIREMLASDTYKDWKFVKAWLIEAETGSYYVVELTKGDNAGKTLRFDQEGRLLDE